jgi:hypothetical protein
MKRHPVVPATDQSITAVPQKLTRSPKKTIGPPWLMVKDWGRGLAAQCSALAGVSDRLDDNRRPTTEDIS